MSKSINVTKIFLPPIEEYTSHVQRAWDNEWLTNRGELIRELEDKLKNYLSFTKLPIQNPFSSMHSYTFLHQASNRFQQPMTQSIREMVS